MCIRVHLWFMTWKVRYYPIYFTLHHSFLSPQPSPCLFPPLLRIYFTNSIDNLHIVVIIKHTHNI